MHRIKIVRRTFVLLFAFFAWVGPVCIPHEVILLMRLITLGLAMHGCRKEQVVNDGFFWVLCAYSIVMLLSVFLFDRTLNHVLKTASYTLVPLTIYLFTTHPNIKENFIDAALIGSGTLFSIDALLAFLTTDGTGINMNGQPLYFVGGKFQICYMYILFMMLCFLKFEQKRRTKILLLMFGVFTAVYVDCNTGAIGIFITGMMMFVLQELFSGKKLYYWVGGSVFLSYLVVFAQIQTNPLVKGFIENVLHRNATLTGRMAIYENISDIMQGHWLLGYGYTSQHMLEYADSHWLGKIPNTQNGFLQIIYISGLIGLALYLVMLCMLIGKIRKISSIKEKRALLAVLVGFFVIAIVEIPFTSGVFNIIIGFILFLSRKEYWQENRE